MEKNRVRCEIILFEVGNVIEPLLKFLVPE